MGEVRACVYFSVIFLCFQISVSKPFFGNRFWCDLFCEDSDDVSTASSEDYFDSWCDDCPTRRPRPTTTMMPPAFPYPGVPGAPGMPGAPVAPGLPPGAPINYNMMGPPQGGVNFPDNNRGWWNVNFIPWNPAGGQAGPGGPPPYATPAPGPAPTKIDGAKDPATAPGAPAEAVTTAAATTAGAVAATTAAPAAPAAAAK